MHRNSLSWVLLILLILPVHVLAYKATPLFVQCVLQPGIANNYSFTVTGTENFPEKVEFLVRDYWIDVDGNVKFDANVHGSSGRNLIKMLTQSLVLGNGQSQEAKFQVVPPTKDIHREYFATITVVHSQDANVKPGIATEFQSAIIIHIIMPSVDVHLEASVGDLDYFATDSSLVLTAIMENQGNRHIRGSLVGELTYLEKRGLSQRMNMSPLASLSESAIIFPYGKRRFASHVGRYLAPGKYNFRVVGSFDKDHQPVFAETTIVVTEAISQRLSEFWGYNETSVFKLSTDPLEMHFVPGRVSRTVLSLENLDSTRHHVRMDTSGIGVDWLRVKPVEFDLAPHKKKNIKFLARFPKDLESSMARKIVFHWEQDSMATQLLMENDLLETYLPEIKDTKYHISKSGENVRVSYKLENPGRAILLIKEVKVTLSDNSDKLFEGRFKNFEKVLAPGTKEKLTHKIPFTLPKKGIYFISLEVEFERGEPLLHNVTVNYK